MTTLVEEEINCPDCDCRIKVTIPIRRMELSPCGSKILRDGEVVVKKVVEKVGA